MFHNSTTARALATSLAMTTALTARAPSVTRAGAIARPAAGAPTYEGDPFAAHYAQEPSGPRAHYLDGGEGEVPLLLIHGIPTQACVSGARGLIPRP